MYDKDTNQKVRPPRRGEAITAADMNKIVALILQTVKGGRGVLVKRVGQSIVIEMGRGKVATGGGGGSNNVFYSATTKAGLPSEPNLYKFGRVDGVGSDNGMVCVVNPDHDGWDALNFFE